MKKYILIFVILNIFCLKIQAQKNKEYEDFVSEASILTDLFYSSIINNEEHKDSFNHFFKENKFNYIEGDISVTYSNNKVSFSNNTPYELELIFEKKFLECLTKVNIEKLNNNNLLLNIHIELGRHKNIDNYKYLKISSNFNQTSLQNALVFPLLLIKLHYGL